MSSHPEKKPAPTLEDIKGLDAPLSVASVLQGQIYDVNEAVKDLRLELSKLRRSLQRLRKEVRGDEK